MAPLSLLLALFCALYSGHVFAFTNTTPEITIGDMDIETANRITGLFQQNLEADFSWDDPELSRFLSRDASSPDTGHDLKKRVDVT